MERTKKTSTLIRCGLAITAVALLVGGPALAPTHLYPSGGRSLEGWWLAMLGLALLPVALCLNTSWLRSAWLFSGLLVGFCGQLGQTTQIWIPILLIPPLPTDWLGRSQLFALCFEAAIVATLAGPRLARFGLVAIRWIGWSRALILVGLLTLCSVQATRYLPLGNTESYAIQLGLAALLAGLHLAAIAGIALAAPLLVPRERERFDRLETWLATRIHWLGPLFAFATALLFAGLALDFFPKIPDEVAYLFQARTFAQGGLTAATPPVSESFAQYLLTDIDGRRWAMPPPGWAATLALGAAIDLPYIVNPLLGALGLWLAIAFFRRSADERSALGLALLFCLSPWFLEINASLMTHSLSLVLVLCAWVLLERVRDGAPAGIGFLAGLAMGASVLVRPLEGVVVGTMTGLFGLGLFARRLPTSALVAYGVGCITTSSLFLVYNAHITGDPFLFPMSVYLDALWYPGVNSLGFGPDIGNAPGWAGLDPYPGHGWRDVLLNASQNFYGLNIELFGWGCGSLILAGVFVLRGSLSTLDKRLAALTVALLASYTLYWFSGGNGYGPRYWYITIVPLMWFSLRGTQLVIAAADDGTAGSVAERRVQLAIGACGLIALLCFLPWRAVGKFDTFRGFHSQYRSLAREHDLDGHLVLVRTTRETDWSSAYTLMWPTPYEDEPIFALDRGSASTRALLAAYPDRRVLVVRGLSDPNERIQVVEGPLTPGTPPRTLWQPPGRKPGQKRRGSP